MEEVVFGGAACKWLLHRSHYGTGICIACADVYVHWVQAVQISFPSRNSLCADTPTTTALDLKKC